MNTLLLVLGAGVGLVLGFVIIGLAICCLEWRHEHPVHRAGL